MFFLRVKLLLMKRLRSSGFTIIEVIVAGLLLLGLAFAFFQFLNNAMKGQKNVQNAVDFDILKTSLNLVFNTKACDGSLYTTGATPALLSFVIPPTLTLGQNLFPTGTPKLPIGEIKHGGSTIVKINDMLPGQLKIDKLEITEAVFDGSQILGPNPATDTYHAFSTIIAIQATKAEGSMGRKVLSTNMSVRLLAQAGTTNTGRIEKCSTSTSSVPQLQVFSTPGTHTWTVPPGVTKISVEAWGGGGGGCGGDGGAGGGGAYSFCLVNSVQPGQIYNVIVGAGGAAQGLYPSCPGGTATGGAFSGSSSFSGNGYNSCLAPGGQNGAGGGGVGGSGGLGDIVIQGQSGQDNYVGGTFMALGGSSPRGGNGSIGTGGTGSDYSGIAPGGGGGIISGYNITGAGAPGAVHIRW